MEEERKIKRVLQVRCFNGVEEDLCSWQVRPHNNKRLAREEISSGLLSLLFCSSLLLFAPLSLLFLNSLLPFFKGRLVDMDPHQNACVHRLVDCPYSKYGCEARMSAKECDTHVQTHLQQHLALVEASHAALQASFCFLFCFLFCLCVVYVCVYVCVVVVVVVLFLDLYTREKR